MENLVNSYKELSKLGKISLSLQFIRDDEFSHYQERMSNLLSIISNMRNFNERDNKKIANTFKDFYESLPKLFLNEGNPNNGSFLFQEIEIIGDDTIVLSTYHHIDNGTLETIKQLVNEYGRKIYADERSVSYRKVYDDFGYTIIKFWWD